jgi:two-component system, OmpR family, heavy metal sensor histidine kinase CusS
VGQLPLSLADVDLSTLIRSAIEDVEAMAPDLTVEADIPPGIYARVDADLAGQVVRNMTSNAIKYNREGGTIRFELGIHDATVRFTLANTGDAIPEEDRERIFDRFCRVDKARSREIRGTGLGLSLAREIAHAHGGELVLDPPRDGTVAFTLTIPRG